jgi:Transglutaminase-like superfamily
MKRFCRLLAFPPAERLLLVKTALLLAVIRLGLRLLPFRALLWLLNGAARAPRGLSEGPRFSPERIASAVTVTGPYMLNERPCLTQALAVRLLLVRRGYPARLRLGVTRGERGEVLAHAWVESDGRVIIGGSASELERYTPLLTLDTKTA